MKTFLNIILLILCLNMYSQNFNWVKQLTGSKVEGGGKVCADAIGNVYTIGSFDSVLQLGNTTFTSNGGYDFFIAKYSSSGTLLWAVHEGGFMEDVANDICIDGSGNLYVTGYFSDSINFSGTALVSYGDADIYIAKYGNNGTFKWVKQAGSVGLDQGMGICNNKNGDIYVCGGFSSICTFGQVTKTAAGIDDIFLAKYDSLGGVQWVSDAGGIRGDVASSVVADSLAIYITGYFGLPYWMESGNFSANFGNITLANAGVSDIFIAKYDLEGDLLWVKQQGGAGHDEANGICLDNNFNIYIAGASNGTGPASGMNSSQSVYVAKLDSSGSQLWSITSVGQLISNAYDIVSSSSEIYITGMFDGEVTFGNTTINTGHSDYTNILVACFDFSGNVKWLEQAGGNVGRFHIDAGIGLAINNFNELYVSGFFTDTASFWGTVLNTAFPVFAGVGYVDIDGFLVKLSATGPSVGIKNFYSSAAEITCYPNPSRDFITMNIPNEIFQNSQEFRIHIENINGQLIKNIDHVTPSSQIFRENIPNGIYFLTLENNNAIIFRQKIIFY